VGPGARGGGDGGGDEANLEVSRAFFREHQEAILKTMPRDNTASPFARLSALFTQISIARTRNLCLVTCRQKWAMNRSVGIGMSEKSAMPPSSLQEIAGDSAETRAMAPPQGAAAHLLAQGDPTEQPEVTEPASRPGGSVLHQRAAAARRAWSRANALVALAQGYLSR
jgi:hypothetical protein